MADEAILALPERAGRPADSHVQADKSPATPAQNSTAQEFTPEALDTVEATGSASPSGSATERSSGNLNSELGLDALSADSEVAAPGAAANAMSNSVSSARPDVTDYDHIFADPSINIVEAEDDLFPWDSPAPAASAGTGSTAATGQSTHAGAGSGTPAVATSATPAAAPLITAAAASAAPQPTRIKVDGPRGVVEGANNPVSTYLAKSPNIRLTFSGAVAAIAVVTVGLGLVEALLSDHIGMITAVISVATALAATWFVSDRDRNVPALALPVAWLACALLPGQLTAPPSGSVALKQVVVVLGVLGDNALFIILGSVTCYVLARLRSKFVHEAVA